jgi:hypothetical protein
MSSYWTAVGLFLGLVYGLTRYLVWDFLWMRKALNKEYSGKIARAHLAIHDRKFLPVIASICASVAGQMKYLDKGVKGSIRAEEWIIEILTEDTIGARFREAFLAFTERIALDRSYWWACHLSIWVALTWCGIIGFFVGFFFRHFDAQTGVQSLWTPLPGLRAMLLVALGASTLGLYRWALHRFIRLLEANPLEEARDVHSSTKGR